MLKNIQKSVKVECGVFTLHLGFEPDFEPKLPVNLVTSTMVVVLVGEGGFSPQKAVDLNQCFSP